MLTVRDTLVALISGLLALAVSLGVLAMRAGERRAEVDAMEERLVRRMAALQAKNEELAGALDRCRVARGQGAGGAP